LKKHLLVYVSYCSHFDTIQQAEMVMTEWICRVTVLDRFHLTS